MLEINSTSKLVYVHEVDRENDYEYAVSNIYRMIPLVFEAKVLLVKLR